MATASNKGSLRDRVGAARMRFERLFGERAIASWRRVSGYEPRPDIGYILLLAHARSGSTLLMHLLDAHPDVTAAGEHHVSYVDDEDLRRLEYRTAFAQRDLGMRPKWVADKLVYNKYKVADAVLAHPRTRCIFLLRRPEHALPSIGRINPSLATERLQLRYYSRRLAVMVEYAQLLGSPDRAFFATYRELVERPHETLFALSSFLGLEPRLEPSYELGATTGRKRWGDPSATILSGHIATPRPDPTSLTPQTAGEGADVFLRTEEALRALCTTVAWTPDPSGATGT